MQGVVRPETLMQSEIKPSCYAVHQLQDGWELIAPSDDPYRPAYGRVEVIRRYGWQAAGRDRDGQAPLSWNAERRSCAKLGAIRRLR